MASYVRPRSRSSFGRARWRLLGALASFALIAAACGSTPKSSGSTAASSASGAAIKIGFLIDETGPLASYGYAHKTVGEAAVQYINAHGGVGGRKLDLVEADTQSQPSVAVTKARELVLSDHVDFLMGSNTSAVVLAVAPVAKALKTPYFGTAGGALLTTPGRGNRYVFDFNTNVAEEVRGVAHVVSATLPSTKTWATVVDDYSWGIDNETNFASAAKEHGLTVAAKIRVPLGTGDWLSYMQGKIGYNVQGVYFANFGSDFVSFIQGMATLDPNAKEVGANFVLSGQDLSKLPSSANGMYVISGYPQECDTSLKYDAQFRQIVGMNCQGHDASTGKDLIPSYSVSTWSTLWAIKTIVEKSGWKSPSDVSKFIKTIEGYLFPQSLASPGCPCMFRAQDHLMLKQDWMLQLEDGSLKTVDAIPSTAMTYPAVVNYPKEQPF